MFALGAGDEVVRRSHECDDPASVRDRPVVSWTSIALEGLFESEIDGNVVEVGRTIGRLAEAAALVARNNERLERVRSKTRPLLRRTRVTLLEWVDFPF